MIKFFATTRHAPAAMAGRRRSFPRHLLRRCTPLAIGACVALAAPLICASTLNAKSNDRPNIVLMMADDMGLGDTSAYQDFTGNSDSDQISTPNMQRLARMGIRFTDAHTPSSRCSPTRYALLTGRYPWRNRLKHWVLFGAQGDPMIEVDRPTLGSLMQTQGYRTAVVGKWHVGLRYRRSDGGPAAGWDDADLTQPLWDTPLDHGFDFCRFTSRSHGTSGATKANKKKPNNATQSIGPGHIHGRLAIGATGDGKRLVEDNPNAYVLEELGSRHSDHAIEFLDAHRVGGASQSTPFFLYYPSNSNHGPYTPDTKIAGKPVAGAARNMADEPMDVRSDYIYENDVALGRLIDYLESNDDPRRPGCKLIENTIVIFTSDNGAERDSEVATGPFRSHKGSAYEGGHRVPFIVAWSEGGVGDGDASKPGKTSDELIGLHDLFATFSEVLGQPLPDLRRGEKGAEDSVSVLAAWKVEPLEHGPMFFHDHSQAKDHAASAIRIDDPVVNGQIQTGQWKLFFDASLLRRGEVHPVELFDLSTDPEEQTDRLPESSLRPLVKMLSREALRHRTAGGHRMIGTASDQRITFDWRTDGKRVIDDRPVVGIARQFASAVATGVDVGLEGDRPGINMSVSAARDNRSLDEAQFDVNPRGLGIDGGRVGQVDDGEAVLVRFDRDVIVESVSIVAGNGQCGGFYRVGESSPLAIYCVDADIDAQDQSGILSDIGLLKKGQTLRLDSSPHYGVETPGKWRLADITVRLIAQP
jgi:arylsulfatase A